MLAIRLQRLGRKGYPTYRIAIQESQRHPSSGRVVAYVGSYNPHTNVTTIDQEKIQFYLGNGAQPTPRVVKILLEQNVVLPSWVVKHSGKKTVAIKNSDKLRKNRPVEAAPAVDAKTADPVETEKTTEVIETTPEADTSEQTAKAE